MIKALDIRTVGDLVAKLLPIHQNTQVGIFDDKGNLVPIDLVTLINKEGNEYVSFEPGDPVSEKGTGFHSFGQTAVKVVPPPQENDVKVEEDLENKAKTLEAHWDRLEDKRGY